jgi:hypothetical protein
MRTLIVTRAHFPRMRSHRLFGSDEFTFVVGTPEEADLLVKVLPHSRIIVPDDPIRREDHGVGTVAQIREFISQQVLDDGEWATLVDDNVDVLTCVHPWFYDQPRLRFDESPYTSKEWREFYSTPVTMSDRRRIVDELIDKCIEEGTIYGGFASEDNYYFRASKWSLASYIKTKFAVFRNDRSLSWTPFPGCMFEDMVMTAQVVAKYGCVVANRFVRMHNPYYEPGGIGSEQERIPHLRENCRWLVNQFPGLIKYREGYDWQVQFAIRTRKRINEWRRANGFL